MKWFIDIYYETCFNCFMLLDTNIGNIYMLALTYKIKVIRIFMESNVSILFTMDINLRDNNLHINHVPISLNLFNILDRVETFEFSSAASVLVDKSVNITMCVPWSQYSMLYRWPMVGQWYPESHDTYNICYEMLQSAAFFRPCKLVRRRSVAEEYLPQCLFEFCDRQKNIKPRHNIVVSFSGRIK